MHGALSQSAGISLRSLLPGAMLVGADDLHVNSCTADSRTCRPGDLFAALVGTRHDGHDFAAEAVAGGAAAVLCERPLPLGDVPQYIVRDSREAFGIVCQALAGDPSRRVRVIGVTGTDGKTTTSLLIAGVLAAAGLRPAVIGTLGYLEPGDAPGPADGAATAMTTPDAASLARLLARGEASGCTHAVLEVSSHGLAQRRTAGVRFDTACVTNVRRDHLDYHGSLANYRDAKRRLLEQLPIDGVAVLNVDDPVCVRYLSEIHCPALTVGMQGLGEVTATVIERFASEQTFLLSAGDETVAVRSHLIGDHNVYNAMIATAVGLSYEIDLLTIARGLESVKQVPGRLQRIECGQPFSVFIDYAHTPAALASALRTLRQVVKGRVICVFGAGGERDRAKRPAMARAVECGADLVIVTSDNPRSENPLAILSDLLRGFACSSRVEVAPDREKAIHAALAAAQPGDCVLVAGKGHEEYQIVGRNRIAFSDSQVARSWLQRHFSDSPYDPARVRRG